MPTAVLRPAVRQQTVNRLAGLEIGRPHWYSQPVTSIAPASLRTLHDRHRDEVVAPNEDAAVARRLRVEPDGAHREAERRRDEHPVQDEHHERDEDPDQEP